MSEYKCLEPLDIMHRHKCFSKNCYLTIVDNESCDVDGFLAAKDQVEPPVIRFLDLRVMFFANLVNLNESNPFEIYLWKINER